jgi:succinylglutamate desuccinylase
MKRILIVASTHGHERIGLRVIERLKNIKLNENQVEFIIGNPNASKLNQPFIESDLNRVFPGKKPGTYEEELAVELSRKIAEFELVIDIHSTKTTDLGENSMLIITKYDDETKKILDLIHPPKVLLMKYKSDSALISQAKIGVAFEYGRDDSEQVLEATLYDIAQILLHYNAISSNPFTQNSNIINSKSEIFEVYDAYKKEFEGEYLLDNNVTNFKQVQKDELICTNLKDKQAIYSQDTFYPILFGNNRYRDILGFKARKLD